MKGAIMAKQQAQLVTVDSLNNDESTKAVFSVNHKVWYVIFN
jgi:hypothetical protein